jgi:hypothetical protein
MVRAILEGSKTQTRRLIKPQPGCGVRDFYHRPDGRFQPLHLPRGKGVGIGDPIVSPYGLAGYRLWVRETLHNDCNDEWYYVGGEYVTYTDIPEDWSERYSSRMCCPSIHMPRWASRITLDVKRVWVERVQDISRDDAIAEGIAPFEQSPDGRVITWKARDGMAAFRPQIAFEDLWDSINGKPRTDGTDISWAANPWVWCIEFERVTS